MERIPTNKCILYKFGVFCHLLPYFTHGGNWKCFMHLFSKKAGEKFDENYYALVKVAHKKQQEVVMTLHAEDASPLPWKWLIKSTHMLHFYSLKIVSSEDSELLVVKYFKQLAKELLKKATVMKQNLDEKKKLTRDTYVRFKLHDTYFTSTQKD